MPRIEKQKTNWLLMTLLIVSVAVHAAMLVRVAGIYASKDVEYIELEMQEKQPETRVIPTPPRSRNPRTAARPARDDAGSGQGPQNAPAAKASGRHGSPAQDGRTDLGPNPNYSPATKCGRMESAQAVSAEFQSIHDHERLLQNGANENRKPEEVSFTGPEKSSGRQGGGAFYHTGRWFDKRS
jgi:hypothetical protein